MNGTDLLLPAYGDPPPAALSERHLHVGGVVVLAVVEGAVGGWFRGGAAGALVGGLVGLLVGPLFAWWSWAGRRGLRRLSQALLLGLIFQVAATAVIAALVQQFVGVPALEFVAFLAALLVGSVGVPLLMFLVISREKTWSLRGGAGGIAVGAAAGAVLYGWLGVEMGLPPTGVVGLALAGAAVVANVGMFLGAFVAAGLRAKLRWLRRLQIRARHRRTRPAEGADASPGIDLGDVAAIATAHPAQRQTALLLLEALRDGIEELYFEPVGLVCRLTRRQIGTAGETLVLPVPAHALAAALGEAAEGLRPVRGVQEGCLRLGLAGHTIHAAVTLDVSPSGARGVVGLPLGCTALAGPAADVLRDYQEYRGEPWGPRWVPVTLRRRQRPEGASVCPDAEREATPSLIRLIYPGSSSAPLVAPPIEVVFDGRLLGVCRCRAAFEFHVEASTGPHLLQLSLRRRRLWPRNAFVLCVAEPGVYEVRLRWSALWGTFHTRPEVLDWTEHVEGIGHRINGA